MQRQSRPYASLRLCAWILAGVLMLPQMLPAKTAQDASRHDPLCISRGWPQENSDLPVDPSLIFGTLENGVRYVLKQNREPRNRVAMYLNIQAGSLQETEEQRGLAHYLEHMLFNGTTHYPPGTLVEYFQSIGMGFGADTNAHTGYDETVYKLTLPAGDEKTLAEGLLVLADYARGALLLETEVERERGIIVAEKRSRDSAQSRTRKAQLARDFAGTLVARRDPIGTDAVLQHADAALLRSYYDSWYRPDNMFVVLVGDMDTKLAERLLKQHFSPLNAAADTQASCPDYGSPQPAGISVEHIREPELGFTEISIATVAKESPGADTLQRETAMLHRYLALVLLNNRLQQLERDADSPLSKSMAFSGNFIPQFNYSLLTTRTEARDWEKGLNELQTALEQSLRHGFTASELERGKKEVKAMLEKEVQTADARDSRDLAMELIRNLNDNEVSLSPVQKRDIFAPVIERSTLTEINQAIRFMWPPEPRTVTVAGTALADQSAAMANAQIQARYDATARAEMSPWQETKQLDFPYLPLPQHSVAPSTVSTDPDIDMQSLEFANGLIAHIKKTDFQPNQVEITAHFGKGRQDEPLPGAALLAQGVVQESGTGTMTREQLHQALAGSNVSLNFTVGPESFSFHGAALSSELELLLQLLYTRLHDPALQAEGFTLSKEQLRQMYAQMGNSVEGLHQLEGERFLSGGSRFYSMPGWQEVDAVTLQQLNSWLLPVFAEAALEINIVGDLDPQKVGALLGSYFGTDRRPLQPQAEEKPLVFPQGETLTVHAPATPGKAQLTVAWKTDDFWKIDRTRGFNMLASILDDRLRVTIREKLGATYSPQVFSLPSRIDSDFGLLESRLIVDPAQSEQLAEVVRTVAADIGREGIGEEEFKRAQEPVLTGIRDQMRSNAYWLHTVLSLASRHPEQLEWPKTIMQDFSAMKKEHLERLARQYLQPNQAASVIVRPKEEARP